MHVGNGNKELSFRDSSKKNQRRHTLLLVEDLLEDFRNCLRVAAPSFLGLQNFIFVIW